MGELSGWNSFLKRSFDFCLAFGGILLFGWLIGLAFLLATLETKRNGFFTQERIGQYGKPFQVIKIRTMRESPGCSTTVTTAGDLRITPLGRLFRKTKIDELPQLFNVLIGHMSFVGPRPDVPGFADRLQGDDTIILSVRPGITGPATLKYRKEEQLLQQQDDPEGYNSEVIFPDKVRINKEYVLNYRFLNDLKYIWQTLWH